MMARANRNYVPGLVWHITHRCHKREFLLKFVKDKRTWLRWMEIARKKFDLCILNFVITSNHIHLLLLDWRGNEDQGIARSIQLAAGRVAQEYNLRKERSGALWEDRYHATAVETGEHFIQCLTYIDLNMVRAGVVDHPGEWPFGGYRELLEPRTRFRNQLLDWRSLAELLNFRDIRQLREAREEWVRAALQAGPAALNRDPRWTESVAVGSKMYVNRIVDRLEEREGMKARNEYGEGADGRDGANGAMGKKGETAEKRAKGEKRIIALAEAPRAYLRVFGAKNMDLRPKNSPEK